MDAEAGTAGEKEEQLGQESQESSLVPGAEGSCPGKALSTCPERLEESQPTGHKKLELPGPVWEPRPCTALAGEGPLQGGESFLDLGDQRRLLVL